MKNDMKKYLSLGAVLAGSALMISCDGDDGNNGANGTDGTDGREENLPIAAPTNEQLAISDLRLVVDDNGDTTFDNGSEWQIEFDSTLYGSIIGYDVQGWSYDWLYDEEGDLAEFSDMSRPSDTQLQFDVDSEDVQFEDLLLTVTASQSNTLIGSWTALGNIANVDAVELLVDNVDNTNLVAVVLGEEADVEDPENYQGYVIAGTTPVFRLATDALGNGTSLPAGGEAILVSAALIDEGANAGTSYVFVRLATENNPIQVNQADLEDIVADLDGDNTFTDGDTLTNDWQLLAVEGEVQPISGTFVLDVKGFGTNGSDFR